MATTVKTAKGALVLANRMPCSMRKGCSTEIALVAVMLFSAATSSFAQEGGQDRVSQAMDSTATQWSYQFAYQWMPNYFSDTLDNGQTRPAGATDYAQLRIVAPIPKSDKIPFTMLPRLTVRHYEDAQGDSGFGQTELFVLGIVDDWGTGRWGLGPLVNIPGSKKLDADKWGYGLAGAIVNTTGSWFYGALLTQSWRDQFDPTVGQGDAEPLGIAPFLNYQLGDGWYIGNGDMVARYDWDSSSFYLPIGVRVGKVVVGEKSSWNFYAEYQTSLIYDDWPGSAVEDSVRLNVTYVVPVSF